MKVQISDTKNDSSHSNEPWLNLIGMGDNGLESLSPKALQGLRQSAYIFTSSRLKAMIETLEFDRPDVEIFTWQGPLADSIKDLLALKGEAVTVLATGNPLHYGIGTKLLRHLPLEEMRVLPAPSSFSLAASRLGWSLQDCETISLHGRPLERFDLYVSEGVKILSLTSGVVTLKEVANRLTKIGFGASILTVLAHMEGRDETSHQFTAADFVRNIQNQTLSDFHLLAINCKKDFDGKRTRHYSSLVPGLPDDAFEHDGQLTKQEVRALTVSALSPKPHQLFWDVGAGCGSIAIEWLRSLRGKGETIAIEKNKDRIAMIEQNALALGIPHLQIKHGEAIEIIPSLRVPDAIFLGGGLTASGLFETCWQALKPGGRMVVNGVTLEAEMKLLEWQRNYGGSLMRMSFARAKPIGQFQGWSPMMTITQWKVDKPYGGDV